MQRKLSSMLLASTAFAFALAIAAPSAQAATDAKTLEKLQAQIAALQEQVNSLKTSQAQVEAKQEAQAAAPAATEASKGSIGDKMQASIKEKTGATVSVGGYFEADAIFRQQNQNTDTASNWNASIPYTNSAEAHQREFRGTARNTRLFVKATGDASKTEKLTGYVEADFAGSATNASERQTSNYTPRLRQAWGSYENSDWGTHLLAGQAWSLATLGTAGIAPDKISGPAVIDSGLVPGYVYTRSAQARVAQDFADKKIWAALSLEEPETIYGTAVPTTINSGSAGSNITGATPYSTSPDYAPDVIAKVAFDPGYGHYEMFGIARFFHDRTTATAANGQHSNEAMGYGGGVGTVLPLLNKKVDFSASFMGGKGVGRYAATQLGDVAFTPSGDIKPLTELTAYTGVVGHVTPTWDVFAYAGIEQVMRENSGDLNYGYGNFTRDNSGCYYSGGTCTAQTQRVWQVTGGVWKTVYAGNMGNVKWGLQNSVTRKDAFSGLHNQAPHAYENVTMTAIRFTPSF